MKIVQFANFYTPTSGGLRTCVEETGRGYTDRGHTRVLVVPGLFDADELTPAGRRVTIASPSMFGSDEYRMVTARRRVFHLLDEIAPDVLEISDKLAVAWLSPWARRNRVPTVLFSHERIDAVLGTRLRLAGTAPVRRCADAVNRALRRRVDRVVCASAYAAAEFERAGIDGVGRVPLGVDLETFAPASMVENGVVQLVLVSRLSTEKRPELAIETLRTLWRPGTPVRLTIIGDGPLRQRMQLLAEHLPVRFVGHVADRPTLARMIAAADIALCPSSVETFGLATLEALACGTPVVVPTAGALRELVDGRPDAGAVCPPTPEDFADGVRRLLAVPASVRRTAARSVATGYPWDRTISSLLALHASATAVPV